MQHTIHCQHYQTFNHTRSVIWAPLLNNSQLRVVHIIVHIPFVSSDPGVMSSEMARVLEDTHANFSRETAGITAAFSAADVTI